MQSAKLKETQLCLIEFDLFYNLIDISFLIISQNIRTPGALDDSH